ncbi:SNF2 helicase associated domain-containing protein [Candidatus Clostridium stratigraminis]|uniref:SNF2 helicase associated domain-containing protein n=1 Tax=Candidatus Clostridium stratigraminis TaxID=3381661 RepID=A0ABW8T7J8_9CLOT
MFDIDENRLKEAAGKVMYARGLDVYLRNKIRSLDTENEEENGKERLIVKSVVQSSYGLDSYNVIVSIPKDFGTLGYTCDCSYGKNNNNICKHSVAVLLKWSREKDRILKKENRALSRRTEELIEYFKSSMKNREMAAYKELNLEIKYEFEAEYERVSSIELKIGEERTYVVRGMRDFLSAIYKKDREIEYGKNFTFNPLNQGFKTADKELIGLLLEIYEFDALFSNGGSASRYWGAPPAAISGKKIYLTDSHTKRFFEIMKKRSFDAIINKIPCNNISVLEENMPLEFDIKLNKNSLIIKQEKEIPVPLTEDGSYFFYEKNIYNVDGEQSRIYIPFFNEINKSKTSNLSFNKEELSKIASYILPNLKYISKNIRIDKTLESSLYEEPLSAMIYLDRPNDGITADIIFKYGEEEISPFNEKDKEQSSRVLVRDINKELQLTSILEAAGFEKTRTNYLLMDEEALVGFLAEGINKVQEIAEVYYSDSFKNMKIYTSSNIKSSIRLNDEDLLEFSFNIEGVEKSELKDILDALRQRRKYHKLKKGGFVALQSKELQDMGSMLDYLDVKDSELEKDKIILAKYNALYVDQALKGSNIAVIERNKKFRELVNNIKEVQDLDFKLPEHLEGIMRGYQKFGFKWFKTLASCGFGGILADEMGLGKTLQTIAFIEAEVIENEEEKKPSLVIAPSSLVYNWKNEVEKFAPNLKALIISGSKDEREEKRKEIEEADLVITSYPLIRRDIEDYKEISFRYCILDEAQQIKNPTSINAQSVKDIKAKGYFALTGTPIENSLTELWSIFDFIMPGYLLNHNKFLRKYETPIVKNKDNTALEELNKHVKPFILRRLKKDVIKELPPKIEHKLIVEMTEEQKKLYAAYIAEAKSEIDSEIKEKGFNKSKIKILSTLTRLRQICCDPSTFVENYKGESGKLMALDDLLEDSINEGHRILLFSQFTTVLKNIAKRFHKNEISYQYLDGQTKIEDRGIRVKEFNEGKGSVFLISLKAGGTGLNLTGADVVIHFDPWWNPAVEEQATDRAHRIGQHKTVEVIKLIAQGTIEEKIYNLQEKKKAIINSVMSEESTEESLISQMSQEDIEELFRV